MADQQSAFERIHTPMASQADLEEPFSCEENKRPFWKSKVFGALALVAVAGCAAAGIAVGVSKSSSAGADLSEVSQQRLNVQNAAMQCIGYSPFGSEGYEVDAVKSVSEDFAAIRQRFECVRTFYSQYINSRGQKVNIMEVAEKNNLKVVLGVRVEEENIKESQIQAAIEACKSFPQRVVTILVGSENAFQSSYKDSTSEVIRRMKGAGCSARYGTAQRINEYLDKLENFPLGDLDVLGVNIYPFFSQMGGGNIGDNMAKSLLSQLGQIKSKLGPELFAKVRLTETGWPTEGGSSPQGNLASKDNAQTYFNVFSDLSCQQADGLVNEFSSYFMAIDDNTKDGAQEDSFGLMLKNRSPKMDLSKICLKGGGAPPSPSQAPDTPAPNTPAPNTPAPSGPPADAPAPTGQPSENPAPTSAAATSPPADAPTANAAATSNPPAETAVAATSAAPEAGSAGPTDGSSKPGIVCPPGQIPVSVEEVLDFCAAPPICVGGAPQGNCPGPEEKLPQGSHCGIIQRTGVPGCVRN